MTAVTIPRIGCDRCGATAEGEPRDTTVSMRGQLQKAGWSYERHIGSSGRDFCAACTIARDKAVA